MNQKAEHVSPGDSQGRAYFGTYRHTEKLTGLFGVKESPDCP